MVYVLKMLLEKYVDRLQEGAGCELQDATLVTAWTGLRPSSRDNLPYLGPIPGLRGAYAATGHFRNGILLAPSTGVLLTEMILQQPPTLPLEPYQAARLWQNAS